MTFLKLKKPLIGKRIIKTAAAIFITSAICLALNLPAVFAVITAIVTIEPTTHDSLRKGMERLPASAIGAAFAAISVYFFGESPYAYTFAAASTIFMSQKLKLYSGTLVAALTSVAMIPGLDEGHLLLSVITRLGTTVIGLTISTLVNVSIFPADYLGTIKERNDNHIKTLSVLLNSQLRRLSTSSGIKGVNSSFAYNAFRQDVLRTTELLDNQRKELKYHRFKMPKFRTYLYYKKTTDYLEQAVLHSGNLHYLKQPVSLTSYETRLLNRINEDFNYLLNHPYEKAEYNYFHSSHELDSHLRYEFSLSRPVYDGNDNHTLHGKITLFYELLALSDLILDLNHHLCKTKRLSRNN